MEADRRRTPREVHNRRIAKLGGLAFAATRDGETATRRARDAFTRTFEAEVRARFPELTDIDEISRRAALLNKAHFVRLGHLSGLARSRRPGGGR